ncbi:hypothetical protein ABPG72_015194 [Tetrahymena utriculariae]
MNRVSQKLQNSIYLIIISILVSKAQQYYQLTNGINNIDCDNSLNSKIIQGIEIFQNVDMNNPAVTLNISGWIFLRGFQSKYYTIFSVHQANNKSIQPIQHSSSITKIKSEFLQHRVNI